MTMQTPTIAKIEKWIRVRFSTTFLLRLRIRVRKKNAESFRRQLQHAGSMATSVTDAILGLFKEMIAYNRHFMSITIS